ncbi:MAG: hypothetical protein J7521_01345 [Caulobacter sp.]|nr:hypothetical protein [Caulobacter sp.]
MAYIGFDAHQRPAPRPVGARATPPLAWGRLLAVAASLGAWVAIIAAARAIF